MEVVSTGTNSDPLFESVAVVLNRLLQPIQTMCFGSCIKSPYEDEEGFFGAKALGNHKNSSSEKLESATDWYDV